MKIRKQRLSTIAPYFLADERGGLLLLVLFLVLSLMTAGAFFLQGSLNERAIAGNYEKKIRAQYIAEAGVEVGLALLNERPDYFLHTGVENPVYLKRGEEEEYFTIEWLEPGRDKGDEEYYTLISSGYCRHTVTGEEARAELKVLVELIFEQANTGSNNNTEGEAGAAEHNDNGEESSNNGISEGSDNSGDSANDGENTAEKTEIIKIKIINWSGW